MARPFDHSRCSRKDYFAPHGMTGFVLATLRDTQMPKLLHGEKVPNAS